MQKQYKMQKMQNANKMQTNAMNIHKMQKMQNIIQTMQKEHPTKCK